MGKIQVPSVGGLRKVIKTGTQTAGTTIAGLEGQTITLAQLLALLQASQQQTPNTQGDGSEAFIQLGPGLSGGGPVLGNVPINLTGPLGASVSGMEGEPGEDGLPGMPGPRGLIGPPGVAGPPGDPGDDGDPGPPGPPGAAGAVGPVGPPGPSGSGGGSVLMWIPEDGEDGDDGVPGMPGRAGAAGAAGATGPAGPVGLMGPIGPPGFEGEVGEEGPAGPPGKDASALVQQRGANWSALNGIVASGALDASIVIAEDCFISSITVQGTVVGGGTGSCAVDIWACPPGSFPPTVANTIVSGSSYPAISTGNISTYASPAGILTSIYLSKGTCVSFHLRSSSTFNTITIMLSLQRLGTMSTSGYTDAQAVAAVASAWANTGNVHLTDTAGTLTANYVDTATVNQNGGEYMPSGNIFMWGKVTSGATPPNPVDVSVTFPTVNGTAGFPNNCWGVVCSGQRNVASNGQAGDGSNFVSNISKTGCTITIDANAVNYVGYWFAWGN